MCVFNDVNLELENRRAQTRKNLRKKYVGPKINKSEQTELNL